MPHPTEDGRLDTVRAAAGALTGVAIAEFLYWSRNPATDFTGNMLALVIMHVRATGDPGWRGRA
jgi:hypothetical protein